MDKIISNKCCNRNILNTSDEMKKTNLCPVCEKQGTLVKNITVKNMIVDVLAEKVGEKDYYLCMSEECDITYYNLETAVKFNKQQVKVPIWFKKDADPKYACYCNKVTEEQVINAVKKLGSDNMKKILEITGAMSNPQCQKKNPLGKCCHKIVQEAINKGLSMK